MYGTNIYERFVLIMLNCTYHTVNLLGINPQKDYKMCKACMENKQTTTKTIE